MRTQDKPPDTTAAPSRAARGWAELAGMSPAYFGMVMATGIVSLAAHFLGQDWIAQALFYLNGLFYPALVVLSVLRALRHPRRQLRPLRAWLPQPAARLSVKCKPASVSPSRKPPGSIS